MAYRQRQHGGGVVFKVDAGHFAIGAAHQVARKGLAQAGAGGMKAGDDVQPVLPGRQQRASALRGQFFAPEPLIQAGPLALWDP